jgi:hypothetical protein
MERPLLKEGVRKPDGDPNVSPALPDYLRAARQQQAQATAGQSQASQVTPPDSSSLYQVLLAVSQLIEQGELRKARAYLEELKGDNAFTDQDRERIAQVLGMIDRAIGVPAPGAGESERQGPIKKSAAKPEEDDAELLRQKQEIADIFYDSMDLYRDGKLVQAREGLVTVLESGLIPAAMGRTIRGYLLDIDKRLAETRTPPD